MPNIRKLKANVKIMTYRVPCLFYYSTKKIQLGYNAPETNEGWVPGTETDCDGEDCFHITHGVGRKIIKVIAVCKPGKYPARVFYVRQWESPSGVVFGKTNLKIKTLGNFKAYELSRIQHFDDVCFENSPQMESN